jgi:hypothetical protein
MRQSPGVRKRAGSRFGSCSFKIHGARRAGTPQRTQDCSQNGTQDGSQNGTPQCTQVRSQNGTPQCTQVRTQNGAQKPPPLICGTLTCTRVI